MNRFRCWCLFSLVGALTACGSSPREHAVPCIRYLGTVALADGIALSSGAVLGIGFGTDKGVYVSHGATFDVGPSDFPYVFDVDVMGLAYSGSGSAVLDVDRDGSFATTGDLHSETVHFYEDEFGGCTTGCVNCLSGLHFTLRELVP